jgi:hypothetical protein
VFFLRGSGVQIRFTRAASGEVTGLILEQGGTQQAARKVK